MFQIVSPVYTEGGKRGANCCRHLGSKRVHLGLGRTTTSPGERKRRQKQRINTANKMEAPRLLLQLCFVSGGGGETEGMVQSCDQAWTTQGFLDVVEIPRDERNP